MKNNEMPDEVFMREDKRYQSGNGYFEVMMFATEEDNCEHYTRTDLVIRKDDAVIPTAISRLEWAIQVLRPVEAAFAVNSKEQMEFRKNVALLKDALAQLQELRGG